MTVFEYDKTFEGLLTVVFDAYSRKVFPDLLIEEGSVKPMFYDDLVLVITNQTKAERVWKGLEKKLSRTALQALTWCWLSELSQVDQLLLRYMRKAIDASRTIEVNFTDPDVLEVSKIWKQVNWERLRVIQFLRFQKAADGTFFAAIEPQMNALALTIDHFKDRFADQKWVIYDIKRSMGYYYNLITVQQITFDSTGQDGRAHLSTGLLDEKLMDKDEKLFQQLWKTYFKSVCIKERLNLRKHKQDMPVRYWKYMTEKQ